MTFIVIRDLDGDDYVVNTPHIECIKTGDIGGSVIMFTSGSSIRLHKAAVDVLEEIHHKFAPIYGVVNDED